MARLSPLLMTGPINPARFNHRTALQAPRCPDLRDRLSQVPFSEQIAATREYSARRDEPRVFRTLCVKYRLSPTTFNVILRKLYGPRR